MVSELLLPSQPTDFIFDSPHTSPYASIPSSPQNFTNFQINNQNVEQDVIDMDFAFDFSGQLEPPSLSAADELFHCGKIKTSGPTRPKSPKSSKISHLTHGAEKDNNNFIETFHRRKPRAQERTTNASTPRHKVSRSLSPLRMEVATNQSSLFNFTWYNKWNLKNLLLFRSTSAGSAAVTKDVKNTSFRSTDGGESVNGSSRRKMKRKVSAHEIHYTANRAVAEERRRKTFLPYKSGLLGCLGFGHNIQEISSRGR